MSGKNPNLPVNGGYNTYIGARYIPLYDGIWDKSKAYEPLTLVYWEGRSYVSKTFVPSNTELTDTDYWGLASDFNVQVEQYRDEVKTAIEKFEDMYGEFSDKITEQQTAFEEKLNKDQADFQREITDKENKHVEDVLNQQSNFEAQITQQENQHIEDMNVKWNDYKEQVDLKVQTQTTDTVTDWLESNLSGGDVAVDKTLTVENAAADAKSVNDALIASTPYAIPWNGTCKFNTEALTVTINSDITAGNKRYRAVCNDLKIVNNGEEGEYHGVYYDARDNSVKSIKYYKGDIEHRELYLIIAFNSSNNICWYPNVDFDWLYQDGKVVGDRQLDNTFTLNYVPPSAETTGDTFIRTMPYVIPWDGHCYLNTAEKTVTVTSNVSAGNRNYRIDNKTASINLEGYLGVYYDIVDDNLVVKNYTEGDRGFNKYLLLVVKDQAVVWAPEVAFNWLLIDNVAWGISGSDKSLKLAGKYADAKSVNDALIASTPYAIPWNGTCKFNTEALTVTINSDITAGNKRYKAVCNDLKIVNNGEEGEYHGVYYDARDNSVKSINYYKGDIEHRELYLIIAFNSSNNICWYPNVDFDWLYQDGKVVGDRQLDNTFTLNYVPPSAETTGDTFIRTMPYVIPWDGHCYLNTAEKTVRVTSNVSAGNRNYRIDNKTASINLEGYLGVYYDIVDDNLVVKNYTEGDRGFNKYLLLVVKNQAVVWAPEVAFNWLLIDNVAWGCKILACNKKMIKLVITKTTAKLENYGNTGTYLRIGNYGREQLISICDDSALDINSGLGIVADLNTKRIKLVPFDEVNTNNYLYLGLIDLYGIPYILPDCQDLFTGIEPTISDDYIMGIFPKIGMCGDSIMRRLPALLKSQYGIDAVQMSKDGFRTDTWLTQPEGLDTAKSTGVCDAYVLGLCMNDCINIEDNYAEKIGTIDDISSDNPTFIMYYAKCITELHKISPKAVIFCLVPPETSIPAHLHIGNYGDAIIKVVETIGDENNALVVNYRRYAQYFNNGIFNYYRTSDRVHFKTIGYYLSCQMLNYAISQVIKENQEKIAQINKELFEPIDYEF